MSRAANTIAIDPTPLPNTADQSDDNDVLHFLTRTLQAHCLDAEPQQMLAKLRNLQNALAQQEMTLAGWPDSPSKSRICEALAKARKLVAQLIDGGEIDALVQHISDRDIKAALLG